jgi:predicted CXXCH cytochrome family protein
LLVLFVPCILFLANVTLLGATPTATGDHRNCAFCHLQFNGAQAIGLWQQGPVAGSLGTRKNPIIEKGIGSSRICLSCHDENIAAAQIADSSQLGSLENAKDAKAGTATSTVRVGFDMRSGHPISVDYEAAFSRKKLGGLHHPANLEPLKLFQGRVECATCHDTHNAFRLRVSARDLCLRCHNT